MRRLRSSMGRRFGGVGVPGLCGVAASLSLACGGQVADERALQLAHADLTAVEPNLPAPTAGHSCEELLARFQDGLLAQMRLNAETARNNPYELNPLLSSASALPRSLPLPDTATTEGADQGTGDAAGGARFSTSLLVVAGNDPGDLVKGDGDRIYLLHDTSLFVLGAGDASATEVVASVPLGDGTPAELLVHDGRVAVFSRLYGDPTRPDVSLSPYLRSFTKLTVVDTRGDAPAILREAYFEGDYLTSGRTDNVVRAFVQQSSGVYLDYPSVSYTDIFGDPRSPADIDRQIDLWIDLTTASIEGSTIEDYLAARFERVGGALQVLPASCDGLLLPALAQNPQASSFLISLDLDAPDAAPATVPLFGYAQSAYLDRDTAVVAQADYPVISDPTVIPTSTQTYLHVFQFDGVAGSYTGSGSFSGNLAGLHVDEARSVLTALASNDDYAPQPGSGEPVYVGTTSRVLTFSVEPAGLLALGQSANLPDSYVGAARLESERAYVMTAGEQNHLSVVDLSDPSHPSVAGSLALTGPAYALAPFGSDRFLGIAQVTDPVTYSTQLLLQVLDVSDATAPAIAHQLSLGASEYSVAQYDVRGFSVHPDEGIFAFPLQNYETNLSSLEVYEVSEASGLEKLGSVVPQAESYTLLECLVLLGYSTDPASLARYEQEPDLAASILQQCSFYSVPSVAGSLFHGDDVYTISTAGVTVHALDALAGPPLSSVELPGPALVPTPVALPPTEVVSAPESAPLP